MADVGEIRARLVLSSDQFTRGMQQARTQMDATNRSAERTSKAIDKIHHASAVFATAVGAVFAASIGTAANFEQKMKDVQAVSGESADNMKKLTDLALDMGKKTAFSSAEAASGIEELVKAGVSVKDILNGGLEGALNLAIAGNLNLADAAEIASTALNAFKDDNLSVAQAADILAGAANASATDVGELKYGLSMASAVAAGSGLSFKDTATALATFAQAGLKGSDAGTSLKTLLLTLQPTTKKTGKLFQELGLETDKTGNAFYDAQGHIKSLAEIAQVLHDKFKDLTDGERQAAFKQAFGTDAIRAANILYKEGAKGIDEMWTAMSKVKAADVAKVKLESLKGAFTEFTSSLESVGISIGMDFLPALTQITRQANAFVSSIDDVSKANIEGALAFAGTAAAVALLATSVVKVISALRLLSASPLGLAITAVSLLAGVVAGAVVQQNALSEVSLKTANSMIEQHDALSKNISEFDRLTAKSKLSTEELGRFVDINSELKKTADPNVIARLKDEQDKLQQKSGLTNEELNRLVDINKQIIDAVPTATTKITAQGNSLLATSDAAKKYNAEQLKAIELELEKQRSVAESKMAENLATEASLQKKINSLNEERTGILDKITSKQYEINHAEDKLATAKAAHNEAAISYWGQQIQREKQELVILQQQNGELIGQIQKKQSSLDKVQQEIGKLDEVKRKMVDIQMQQAGLNAKRGEEIVTINNAIAKLEQQKAELASTVPVNQRNTQEYRDARDAIQSQINSLQGTKSKIIEIIGQAAAMNDALGKDINKSVTVTTYNRTISSNNYDNILANKQKYHVGGIVGKPPKLHTGGPAWSVAPPNHNEVDTRLLRNEMVLTESQQSNLMRLIDAGMTGGNNTAFSAGEISELKSLLGVIAQNTASTPSVVVDGKALWNYVDAKQATQTRMNNRNGGVKR